MNLIRCWSVACARKAALQSRFLVGFSEVATARKVLVTQQWGYISEQWWLCNGKIPAVMVFKVCPESLETHEASVKG